MSDIHSVAFIPPKTGGDWTTAEMRAWLKKHKLNPIKGMRIVTNKEGVATQYRWRIIDPEEFKSFASIPINEKPAKPAKSSKLHKRINLIIGFY